MLESLFKKIADLQACNVIKKRLQHRCFPVNIAKSLKTNVLKIICEWLLLPLEVFCKDFVNIAHEKALFGIVEGSIWLHFICFLSTVAFWLIKYLFRIDGDSLRVLAKDFTLCSICGSNQPLWKIQVIA